MISSPLRQSFDWSDVVFVFEGVNDADELPFDRDTDNLPDLLDPHDDRAAVRKS